MKKLIIIAAILVGAANLQAYKIRGSKWPGSNPVVNFLVNERGEQDVPDELIHIERGFRVWNNVPTSVIIVKNGGTTNIGKVAMDQKNVITWAEGKDWSYGKCVVGLSMVWHNGTNISEADIILNSKDFRWSTTGEPGRLDIGFMTAHEVGHALGLDHDQMQGALMDPRGLIGRVLGSRLPADDSAGITFLYPRTYANDLPPVITSQPVTEAIVGLRYFYPVKAEDPDGDMFSYHLSAAPLNMRIDSLTGEINWFPKFLDIGRHTVNVMVRDRMGKMAQQAWTLLVTNLVVYTEDRVVFPEDTVYYEVKVTPMDEYGVYAGNIELSYNKKEMVVLGVETKESIIAGPSFVKNITDDRIRVAFAGSEHYKGEGVLFRVKLLVYPEMCQDFTTMKVEKAFFNDGDPVAVINNGDLFVRCGGGGYGFTVDGRVLYSGTGEGVPGAGVAFPRANLKAQTTDDGYYAINRAPFLRDSFTVHAWKDSGDVRGAVSAFDASLILRNIVGLHDLDDFRDQAASADINGNDLLTAYDAALILRFLTGYEDMTDIGKWVVSPEALKFPHLRESVHSADFTAYMIGDVSGNWNASDMMLPKRNAETGLDIFMTDFYDKTITTDSGTLKGFGAMVTLEKLDQNIFSGEFQITFNSAAYILHGVRPGALLSGYVSESNSGKNRIAAVFAGVEPLPSTGELFEVEILPAAGNNGGLAGLQSASLLYCRFNEKEVPTVDIHRGPKAAPVPSVSAITAAYPNPFRDRISLEFSLADRQQVRISIHDLQGRELAQLASGMTDEGLHAISWNGTTGGSPLPPQVYMLRFATEGYVKSMRLFKVK